MSMTAPFEDIAETAKRTFLKRGTHRPTLLLSFDGLPLVRRELMAFPGTADQRQRALYQQGIMLAEQYQAYALQHVWFILEAWASPPTPGVAASAHPKRQEVLLIAEIDATDEALRERIEPWIIKRNARRIPRALVPHPEWASALAEDNGTLAGTLLISLLSGFAERASRGISPQMAHRIKQKVFHARICLESLTS